MYAVLITALQSILCCESSAVIVSSLRTCNVYGCSDALQKGGEKLGYESEAFAIYDTMKYIKPSVRTLCVGTAFGESAMLLAAGEKV